MVMHSDDEPDVISESLERILELRDTGYYT